MPCLPVSDWSVIGFSSAQSVDRLNKAAEPLTQSSLSFKLVVRRPQRCEAFGEVASLKGKVTERSI